MKKIMLVMSIAVLVCSMVCLLSAKQVYAVNSIQVFHEDFADISEWGHWGTGPQFSEWTLRFDDLGQTVVTATDLYLGTSILNNSKGLRLASNYSNELTMTLVLRFLTTGHNEMASLNLGKSGSTIPGNLQRVIATIRTDGILEFRVDESIDTVGNAVTVLNTGVYQAFPIDGNMHALQFNRSAEGIWTVTLDDTIILSGVESTVANGSAFNFAEIWDFKDFLGGAERRRYDDLSISVGVPDCTGTEAELAAALADLAACEDALATAEDCIADTNSTLSTTGCPADSIGTWYLPPGIDKNQPTLSRNPNAVVIKGVKQ